jgi:hypothetical protein
MELVGPEDPNVKTVLAKSLGARQSYLSFTMLGAVQEFPYAGGRCFA